MVSCGFFFSYEKSLVYGVFVFCTRFVFFFMKYSICIIGFVV